MPTIDAVVDWALKNSPGFLYRYQPPKISRVRSFLLKNHLYATSPKWFNDPFDTLVEFDESGSKEEWGHHHNQLLIKMQPEMSDAERRQRVAVALDSDLHIDMARASYLALRNSTGIVCFTPEENTPHMWECYAQGHKGFCLCFEHSSEDPVFGQAIPVQYVSDYPLYRYLDVYVQDVIVELMVTKLEKWKTENEWRIVFMHSPDSPQPFDPSCLKGIIFGWKAKKRFIQECKALVKKRELPIKIWRSVKSKNVRGMHFVEI